MRCLASLPNNAIRVISITLLILTVLQVSTSYVDMQTDRNEIIALLRGEFDCSGPDGAVDEACMQAWLDGVAEIHFMPAVADEGRAKSIIDCWIYKQV